MIRRDLGLSKDHPIFIPIKRAALAEKAVIVSAMEGYVFVGAGLPPGRYLSLEKRGYVEQVLCRPSGSSRVPHIIRDAELNPLRGSIERVDKSPSLRVGCTVEVVSGMLAALQGVVVDLFDGYACVQFDTRTLVRILTLPVGILVPAESAAAGAAKKPAQPKLRMQQIDFQVAGIKGEAARRPTDKHDRRKDRLRKAQPKVRRPRVKPRVQLGFNFR